MRRVAEFLDRFVGWAAGRDDVLAVVLVGSHARGVATETSDVDLVLVTTHPDRYLGDTEWVRTFGRVVAHRIEHYGVLDSLRVHYADPLEVEYGVTDERWAAEPDPGTRAVLAAGFRVLYERRAQTLTLPNPGN
jgi:hypothetical protein